MTNRQTALLSVSLTLNLIFALCIYFTTSGNYHLLQVMVDKPSEEVTLEDVYGQKR